MARERVALVAAAAITAAWAATAAAQTPAQGFALERLRLAAPGNGWFVLDDLDQRGGLGGALSFSTGYAHNPLVVRSADGSQRLEVVRSQAFMDFGLALTYERFRLSGHFSSPLYVSGSSGVVDGWAFTGPSANVEFNPDTIADVQVGVDVRLLGEPDGVARLGTSLQLFIPSGKRSDYLTDDTLRAVALVAFAGDSGRARYAAQLGVHVRPLNESPVPDSPRGSELVYGVAAGGALPLGTHVLVIGPEIFGAAAFRGFLASDATAIEGLLAARYEGTNPANRVRFKLGVGAGIHPRFGAPEWRAVMGVEVVGHLTSP